MFAGHLGAGLMLKWPGRRIGLGTLFFAVLLLDFLLGIFVLLGRESMGIPAAYRTMADATFDFPWSHGLAASLGWSLAAFLLVLLTGKRAASPSFTGPLVVAAAVFSHFILDALVHVPELPLLGRDSMKVGLSLWKHPVVELMLELLLVCVGGWLYLRTADLSRARKVVLISVLTFIVAMTAVGLLVPMPPQNPNAAAVSWMVTPVLLGALGFWIERKQSNAGSPV